MVVVQKEKGGFCRFGNKVHSSLTAKERCRCVLMGDGARTVGLVDRKSWSKVLIENEVFCTVLTAYFAIGFSILPPKFL